MGGQFAAILAGSALISSLLGASVGADKGMGGIGFVLGLVLGPIGILIVAVLSPDPEAVDQQRVARGMRQCPWCAEFVRPQAKLCRYCQRDLPPLPPAGWHADPIGRHEVRYWDGARWTDHVADGGELASDPVLS